VRRYSTYNEHTYQYNLHKEQGEHDADKNLLFEGPIFEIKAIFYDVPQKRVHPACNKAE